MSKPVKKNRRYQIRRQKALSRIEVILESGIGHRSIKNANETFPLSEEDKIRLNKERQALRIKLGLV